MWFWMAGRAGVASTAANYLTVNDAFVGSSTNRNIELLNAANNNIIRYINATAAVANSAGAGSRVILVGATTTTGNTNNTITNCVVTGGLRGIQDFGQSDAIPNNGTQITNNTVQNFSAIGIFAGSGQTNITIQNNLVQLTSFNVPVVNTVSPFSVAVSGIQQQSLVAGTSTIAFNTISLISTSTSVSNLTAIVDLGTGTENMTGNNITAVSTPGSTTATSNFCVGISLGAGTGGTAATFNVSRNKVSGLSSTGAVNFRAVSVFPAAGSTANINNNFVSVTDPNANASAIFGFLFGTTAGSTYTTNLYYNSIRIGGAQGATNTSSAYGIFKGDANAGSVYNQRNNISIMERTGGVVGTAQFIGFLLNSTLGTNTVNYNTYFALDSANNGFAAGGWDGSIYRNAGLATYKTGAAPQEQNSNFASVTFTSATNLHLAAPSTTATSLYGTPVAGITLDIDNGIRSTTNPFQGADEPGVAVPVELLTFSGVKMLQYNLLQWTTATEQNNKGFDLERSVDGSNFTSLVFIPTKAANGNAVSQTTYSFNDEKPLAVKGFYRLKQMDKDGRFSYSSVITINGKPVTQLSITGVYPNPVANRFNLLVNTPVSNRVSIAVRNFSGQPIMQQQRTLTTGNNSIPMNAAALPAGVYIISVTDLVSNEKISVRFVK